MSRSGAFASDALAQLRAAGRELQKRVSASGAVESVDGGAPAAGGVADAAMARLRNDIEVQEALLVEVLTELGAVGSEEHPPSARAPSALSVPLAPSTSPASHRRLLALESAARAFDAAIVRRSIALRAIEAELRTSRDTVASVCGSVPLGVPLGVARRGVPAALAAWARAEVDGAALQRSEAADEERAARGAEALATVERALLVERRRALSARTELHDAQQRVDGAKQRLWALESVARTHARRRSELRGQLDNHDAQPDALKRVKNAMKTTMATKRELESAAEARRAAIVATTQKLEKLRGEIETLRARRGELLARSPRARRAALAEAAARAARDGAEPGAEAGTEAGAEVITGANDDDDDDDDDDDEAALVLRAALERNAARLVAHAEQRERERAENAAAESVLRAEIGELERANSVASAAINLDVAIAEEAHTRGAFIATEGAEARAAMRAVEYAMSATRLERGALEARAAEVGARGTALQAASDEQRPKTEALLEAEAACARRCAGLKKELGLMAQCERDVQSALAAPAAPSTAVQAERDDAAAQKRARAVGIRGSKSPWRAYMSSSPLPHDVDVDSPILTQLLATWTKNRAEAEALRAWIRLACDPDYVATRPPELAHGAVAPGVKAHMPHCVHLERIGA